MKILVTGATGRIGAPLVRRLAEENHRVRCLVRPGSPRRHRLDSLPVEILEGDIVDRFVAAYALSGVDAAVHLAALPDDDGSRREFEVNVIGTRNLFEAAARQDPQPRIIAASAAALYHASGLVAAPIPETAPLTVTGPWTASKHMIETMGRAARTRDRLPLIIVRLPLTLGPGEFADPARHSGLFAREYTARARAALAQNLSPAAQKALDNFLSLDLSDDPLIVPRTLDGISWKRHVSDVRDIVNGLVRALQEPAAPGEDFNVAGWPIQWEYFIPYLAQKTGRRYLDVRLPITPIHFELDQSKARHLLHHYPRHDALDMVDACGG